MTIVEATRTCLRKYATVTGRARRSEFWWFYLATFLVTTVITVLAVIVFVAAAAGSSSTDSSGVSTGGGVALVIAVILYVLAGLVSLALLLPFIGAAVRRLHDTDRSGWWYLLTFVPVGNIVLIVFWALDGTPGPNRFGPSPKGVAPHGGGASYGQPGSYGQDTSGYGYPTQP